MTPTYEESHNLSAEAGMDFAVVFKTDAPW